MRDTTAGLVALSATSLDAEGLPPIPTKLVEKIRRGEFVDLALLLQDASSKSEELLLQQHGSPVMIFQSVEQAQKKKKQIVDIVSWARAFSIYAAVLAAAEETTKEQVVSLLAHMHLMTQLATDLGGGQWLSYDVEFRAWVEAKGIRKWGELNIIIYGRCLPGTVPWNLSLPSVPHSHSAPPQKPNTSNKRPKSQKPGKYRLIVDLSSPPGVSVNDGIAPALSSVCYPTVDNLASLVVSKGKGAYLVKADIREAYRNIPIHPDDYYLLGVKCDGVVVINKFLPFALRSAPKIFSAVGDAAQWILLYSRIKLCLHYLDDFIMVEGDLVAAKEAKRLLSSTFEKLGLPLEPSKLEGPSTCLTFLGIEVDTLKLQLPLPTDKLTCPMDLLEETHGRNHMLK
uniref:Reverse transcriptase domain-containing protein n=1 Tax=Amphimedon queenslandica TaxID=400682 RepID=A0A1X7TSH8_AMPQE